MSKEKSVFDGGVEHFEKAPQRRVPLVKLDSDLADGDAGFVEIAHGTRAVEVVELKPLGSEFSDGERLLRFHDGPYPMGLQRPSHLLLRKAPMERMSS